MKFWAKAGEKKSEIYIYDYIGNYFGGITEKEVVAALKQCPSKSDLDIYINSPGGDVFAGIAIYNNLRRWDGKKTVYVDGIAASIASVIALSGDVVVMSEGSEYMIHMPWAGVMGTSEDMRKMADSLDGVEDSIVSIYAGRTRIDEKQLRDWVKAETWMSADQAVERGFATKKAETLAMAAEFPLLANFKNTPKHLIQQATNSTVLLARMDMRTASMNRGAPARA